MGSCKKQEVVLIKMVKKDLIFVIIDLISYYISLILAFATRDLLGKILIKPYLLTFSDLLKLYWIPFIILLFFFVEGLYSNRYPFWEEVRRIFKSLTLSVIIIFTIVSIAKIQDKVSRLTILFIYSYGLFVFPFLRWLTKQILFHFNCFKQNVVIIGDENSLNLENLISYIKGNKFLGFKIKKIFLLRGSNNSSLFKEILNYQDEGIYIVSFSKYWNKNIQELLRIIQSTGKKVWFIPNVESLALLNAEIYPLLHKNIFILSIKNNLNSSLNKFLKRVFDIIISLILLVLFSPIFIILMILIKLTSKGPIFYIHERVGEKGKTIKVIKFRTMYVDAQERLEKLLSENNKLKEEWLKNRKLKKDPRITKIGKFLRQTSLDELPQLFNVLKGDMSLVGPRPVTQEELEEFYKEYKYFYYMVKPGITGLWQTSGRNDISYLERVKLDIWYILNWSFWLDLIILIRTIKTVLSKKGAY